MSWTPRVNMVGTLSRCVLLNYRTPADSVAPLLPDGLELVRRGGFAFWNVVLCKVDRMRPARAPEAVGVSYHHVAYRLRVQAMTEACDLRRGLYFVRSDADAPLLGAVGNRLNDFRFHRAEIEWKHRDGGDTVTVNPADGGANAEVEVIPAVPPHDPRSCFPTRMDAREALKYEPMGLATAGRALKLAEVFRDEGEWREEIVTVKRARVDFFDRMGQHDVQLELATRVAALPYRWRLGRRERLLERPRPRVPRNEPSAMPEPVSL